MLAVATNQQGMNNERTLLLRDSLSIQQGWFDERTLLFRKN